MMVRDMAKQHATEAHLAGLEDQYELPGQPDDCGWWTLDRCSNWREG